ncbi:MAG: hypothetical protein WD553_01530 [Gemmatimonadaceae bacterium]
MTEQPVPFDTDTDTDTDTGSVEATEAGGKYVYCIIRHDESSGGECRAETPA